MKYTKRDATSVLAEIVIVVTIVVVFVTLAYHGWKAHHEQKSPVKPAVLTNGVAETGITNSGYLSNGAFKSEFIVLSGFDLPLLPWRLVLSEQTNWTEVRNAGNEQLGYVVTNYSAALDYDGVIRTFNLKTVAGDRAVWRMSGQPAWTTISNMISTNFIDLPLLKIITNRFHPN